MSNGTTYDQRDIVLIPFPYTDLTGAKQRPALIVSNHKLNATEDRICCLITSNPTTDGIALEKSSFSKGSLPLKSWIKPQRIFTINTRIIKQKLCTVQEQTHENVLTRLNSYLIRENR